MNDPSSDTRNGLDFVRTIIAADVQDRKHDGRVITRFPPEPNGYLHVGHAKSICLNFGVANEHRGSHCNLRFDDTNPVRESTEYANAIMEDVRWLGFEWGQHVCYASDYFDALFGYAIRLIESGKAYVCSLSTEEIRDYRGTLTEPGQESPYRSRAIAENLKLFREMRDGEYVDGAHVLRAKIDMRSPNLNMRDPVIYRIRHAEHQRTGDQWCIYPMYDYTHCLSDAIEGVTHSLCTLEFEDHRPLYEWFLDQIDTPCRPQQIEFSRLNLEYAVTSKRLLSALVEEGHVYGWDDPRMPTLRGMRRRGYPASAVREFCRRVGVTKKDSMVEMSSLESCVREELDSTAPRAMCVQNPVRLVIENFQEGFIDTVDALNHPNKPEMGTRSVPFTRELYIERDDFEIDPPKKFFRLAPGREVRLRYAYIVRCEGYETDQNGEVCLIRCSFDPGSKGGNAPDGRKIKGTIHWVSASEGRVAEVHLFERLLSVPVPMGSDVGASLNPQSLTVLANAVVEPSLAVSEVGTRYQFERLGYYVRDGQDEQGGLRFNRTVTLRDSWAKVSRKI